MSKFDLEANLMESGNDFVDCKCGTRMKRLALKVMINTMHYSHHTFAFNNFYGQGKKINSGFSVTNQKPLMLRTQ